jgi:tetratricopeptide (TPR) repeat protein
MRALLSRVVLAAALAAPLGPGRAFAEDAAAEAAELLARAEYGEVEKVLGRVAKKEQAALLRAELLLRTGKLDDAERATLAAEKDGKLEVAAVTLRGEIQRARGKLPDAEKTLRSIEGKPEAHRARLLLGELLIQTGRRKDARRAFMTLIDDYNNDVIKATDATGLAYVGRALHQMRNYREANQAFKEAEDAAGKRPPVELSLWTAELFLEKYNQRDAGRSLQAAEAVAPTDPRVRVLAARLILESAFDFGAAAKEIEKALAVNPTEPAAHFVAAGLALRDLDVEAADAAVSRGLAQNPNDLELLSMQATVRYLADDLDGFKRLEAEVLKRNPEYSKLYQIVSEYAEWEHRYDDIIAFNERALTVDPADGQALAQLGLNLIRAGREADGVKALDKAFAKDPFNVRTFNTLNLYEKTIPVDYVTVDGTPFRIRYAKAEKDVLERYVPALLEEAWASMVSRYKFTPTTPISIELYADDEHFSVRTSGLPAVGIQGVCFGKSLAMLSPEAAPFNWGNILWHELGHVFAIQQSKNHVPRWFTEGLSEYETIARRREWQREEDPALFQGLVDGKVPKVVGFNRAFTHVDDVSDVTMAYYAASQIVVFMVEKYGWEKTVGTLPLWAAGKRTPEVIRASLGVEVETLDREFRAWLDARYAGYKSQFRPDATAPPLKKAEEALAAAPAAAPDRARKIVELGIARARAGKDDEARQAFKEALAVDPKNADALYFLADLSLDEEGVEKPERAKNALTFLDQLGAAGHRGYAVELKRAKILQVMEEGGRARAAFAEASKLDPVQAEPHAELAKMEKKSHDGKAEIEALKKYVLLEQHDRGAYLRLLSLLVERQRWEEARSVAESAIYVDVGNPELHRLYARTLANLGRRKQAIFEYNSAILSGAPPEMATGIYAEMAKGYLALGKKDLADQAKELQERSEKRIKTEVAAR